MAQGDYHTSRMPAERGEYLQRALVSAVNAVLWEMDPETFRFTYVSPFATRLLGAAPSEWLAQPDFLANRVHVDDLSRLRHLLALAARDGGDHEIEYRLFRSDGTQIWVRDRISVIRVGARVKKIAGVMLDQTPLRAAHQELDDVVASSLRCLLWRATVTDDGKTFGWSMAVENEAAAQALLPLDLKPGQTYSEAWYESKFPEDRLQMDATSDRALRSGLRRYSQVFRCRSRSGEVRWLYEDVHIEPRRPGLWRLVGVCTDVTERKLAEEQVQRERNFLTTILDTTAALVLVLDTRHRIIRVNRACERLTGYPAGHLLHKRFVTSLAPAALRKGMRAVLRATAASAEAATYECPLLVRDGGSRVIAWTLAAIPDEQGLTVCTGIDVTEARESERQVAAQVEAIRAYTLRLSAQKLELERANSQLSMLATSDGLTGLKNHRAFQERLTEELMRVVRYRTPLSLLLLDVDRFKRYNDRFGHPAGDRVLRQVATLLLDQARASDFVARYGGEEFAVLLPNTDSQGAMVMAERFRSAIESAEWPECPVTASFGVSTASMTKSADFLIAETDRALYSAKRNGRNCVVHSEFSALAA